MYQGVTSRRFIFDACFRDVAPCCNVWNEVTGVAALVDSVYDPMSQVSCACRLRARRKLIGVGHRQLADEIASEIRGGQAARRGALVEQGEAGGGEGPGLRL